MATELAPRVKIVPHFVPGTIYFIAYSFQVEWKASKLSSMSAGERFRLRSGLDAKWAELAEEARKAEMKEGRMCFEASDESNDTDNDSDTEQASWLV